MPATFEDQLAVAAELMHEVARMESGERRFSEGPRLSGYERELRLAGLAQRIAQAYTVIEGILAFVARRIDRAPVAGEDWHKKLIARCASPGEKPARPALVPEALVADLLELCEFRHVVRNIYPTRLAEEKVQDSLGRLIRTAKAFAAACQAFNARLPPGRKPRRRRHP